MMDSILDRVAKDCGRRNSSIPSTSGDIFEPSSSSNAKLRATLVVWINGLLPSLSLPVNASDEELRAYLVDGTILCQLLNKLKPGFIPEFGGSGLSSSLGSENVKRFLSAMDKMGLPRFQASDLEKGSMKIVLECLLTLRAEFMPDVGGYGSTTPLSRKSGADVAHRQELSSTHSSPSSTEGRRKIGSDSKFQRALRSPVMAEPSAALLHHVGHKFHEVFQLKQGGYADLPPSKISEMMKSNSLDIAPTQSLLSVVNEILDESIERKNGEIPHRVACLLRKVVQEIERRISTQAEHLRTQNNLFKTREEKYQSRIRVLEALATGTSEETQIVMNQLQQIKSVKIKMDAEKRNEDQDVVRLMKEKDDHSQEIAALKQELETAKKAHEERCLEMEEEARTTQQKLEERLKDVEILLKESQSRAKEIETFSESKSLKWSKKENVYQIFTEFQLGALRELKFASQSIKQEVVKTQRSYAEEFNQLGVKFRALDHAAANYSVVLAENRKLHNELQELKGNIRVYCRIRPFLRGQKEKQTVIEYIGENGELVVVNPSKQGKEGRRSFKFNMVYSPASVQAQVYSDIQPLVQSVLDGYNVCIFAYGQTGSGKTYTMTGPDGASEEDWGVNYRALNDLFRISQMRESTFKYEIKVQMMEIYNEQVRDLLSSDGSQKRLGILSTSQANGLAVPEASMFPVNGTADVLDLMNTGLRNRAKGSTAMNERSSRSHSIVTIHVQGKDIKSGSTMHSSLHLVDLAGSERVDRSEVTGDRLKEAQHINKSLSALGDVISALAQKNAHIPYRNSKLTQVLQASLGGQAKTLMFVQLNPEIGSYSETMSTLKFAERASGVELGAARSSKDGRDIRELMEQVASLKDTIAKKDEEIEQLQLLKVQKNVSPVANGEKRSPSSFSDADNEERLSDMLSDSGLSVGTETDECAESANPFPEGYKRPENTNKHKTAHKTPRPPQKSERDSPKASNGLRKSISAANMLAKSTKGGSRWQ
ncbi:kinesin-like protein KIN-14C isoform X1 [Solanum lycopersicum]|uniref:kinesin-like protein KIN-14C isoform X1 n=1 Tax=Solanum lycopersicum TaxID=4081 RepID=UPI000532C715|nr:kinesin-like protein KIN-14C isoform X1 [Solanum lycopersicum]XP_025887425.1 kinesin-like protein KIN-14C isoform X1 [Solanum lycopersicum]